MPSDHLSERAIGRWLAHGVTSRTHPVLHFALRTFFHPLGIEAEALEAEPFSTLEAGGGDWWLREPRWNPARFDRGQAAAGSFGYLLDAPESFSISVSSRGWLMIAARTKAETDLATQAFMNESERGWLAARHSVQAAREAETFLYAAVGALIADDAFAARYALGDDEGFCAAVRQTMTAEADEPNHRLTSAAVSSAAVRATIVR